MIRRRVLPVLVGVGSLATSALTGCGGESSSSGTAQREPSSKPATSSSAKPTASTAGSAKTTPTTLRRGDPVPEVMGGAVAPVPRPAPAPASASPSSGAGAAAPPAAPQAAAAAAEPAAAAAAAPAPVSEVMIAHNHPPDQPCTPLSEAEVQKAFGDLKK